MQDPKSDTQENTHQSIFDIFSQTLRQVDNKQQTPFISFFDICYSYEDAEHIIENLVLDLINIPIKKGDRVALFLPNSSFYVFYFLACMRIGAIIVKLNPLLSGENIALKLKHVDCHHIVTLNATAFYEKLQKCAKELSTIILCPLENYLPFLKKIGYVFFKKAPLKKFQRIASSKQYIFCTKSPKIPLKNLPLPVDLRNETALLIFTSGTTGEPKIVSLSHGNIIANVQQCYNLLPSQISQHTMLCILPFFHIFGLTALFLCGIALKAHLILMPTFDIQSFLDNLKKYPVSITAIVPMIAALMVKHHEHVSLPLPSVIISGGDKLPVTLRSKFQEIFEADLTEGYGLSETSPVISFSNILDPSPSGSCGKPVAHTTVSIRSVTDPEETMALLENGEICVKGPQVMKGYYNNPSANQKIFTKDGFFRTGDIGYLDQKNFLFITDRLKDLIVFKGFNVYPNDVEQVVLKQKYVDQAAVIGKPNAITGQIPILVIVLKKDISYDANKLIEEILSFINPQLSPNEQISEVHVIQEMPMASIGKIDKKELRKIYC